MRKITFHAQGTMTDLRKETTQLGLVEGARATQLLLVMGKFASGVRARTSLEQYLAKLRKRQIGEGNEFCRVMRKWAL